VLEVFNSEGEDAAFVELKSSFVNKVVPLLEEYFFDDWNKIGLILGDNQKSESLKFVRQQTVSYQALFGHNHGLDTYEEARQTYSLAPLTGDDSVWDNAEAYIAIYTSTNQ
jgi:5-methylcytosine-specific restriction protein B